MSILPGRSKEKSDYQGEEHWISVSDLMSALMMIFLLLSVFYMIYWTEAKRLEDLEQQDAAAARASELAAQVAVYETTIAKKENLLTQTTEAVRGRRGFLRPQLERGRVGRVLLHRNKRRRKRSTCWSWTLSTAARSRCTC